MKTLLLAVTLVVYVAADQKHYDGHEMDLDQFHPYQDVMKFLDQLVGTCAAGLTSKVNIDGHSEEGRGLKTLTLSTASAANKPIYFTDRMTHAQEWINVATLLKVIKHMCNNYGTDATVTHLLDTYDFVFAPIQDPDGYEFTRSHERMSRKTPNPNPNHEAGRSCIEVDLNINYNWDRATGIASYDKYETCAGDCTWHSDCYEDSYCQQFDGICCTPDADEGCMYQCTFLSDCEQDNYCHLDYFMCCDPPPYEDCYGHCTVLSDCHYTTYCHHDMNMCCAPPAGETCQNHCIWEYECGNSEYCDYDINMCCDPPSDMRCAMHCFFDDDCSDSQYCHRDMLMCCDPPDHMSCYDHCASDDFCTSDWYCNDTMWMCCDPRYPPLDEIAMEDPISELTDEIMKEDPISKLTDEYVKEDYAVCIEIRGNSFITDPNEIQASFEEIWARIVAAIEENKTVH